MPTIEVKSVVSYEARVHFRTRVWVWVWMRVRVQVWQDLVIKKLLKIFLFIF